MKSSENSTIIEKMKAYVFGELNQEEEDLLDDYLDTHPSEAAIADDLINYCKQKDVKNRFDLDTQLQQDEDFVLEGLEDIIGQTKLKKRPLRIQYKKWSIAATILLLLGMAWWLLDYNTTTYNPELLVFLEEERPNFNSAGSSSDNLMLWEQEFLNSNFDQSVLVLEQFVADKEGQAPRAIFYLAVIYTWQQPPNMERLSFLWLKLKGSNYEKDLRGQFDKAGIELD